jgi:hypothetical protein
MGEWLIEFDSGIHNELEGSKSGFFFYFLELLSSYLRYIRLSESFELVQISVDLLRRSNLGKPEGVCRLRDDLEECC